jgi:predicted N-acetyltransferase YhbS
MVSVREATPADYDEIARLTVAAYRGLDGGWVGDDYAVELADVARRAASGATVLVAEEDGVVVGSVTLTLEDGPLFEWAYGVDGDCGFRMLAVAPEAWGRRIGPALVDECVRRARAAGRNRMIIGSTTWMTTAHRMYETRFGFRRRPDLDQQWGDVTGWAFVLDLDGQAAG